MAEKKLNTTTNVKAWSPNEKQKSFLEILKNYPDGAFLSDIEIDFGVKFATGTINTLTEHELVKAVDGVRESQVIYRDVQIATKKDKVKKYYLA